MTFPRWSRRAMALGLAVLASGGAACGSHDEGSSSVGQGAGGAAGHGGSGGSGGQGGKAGQAGFSGKAGSSGKGGSGGKVGSAGASGQAAGGGSGASGGGAGGLAGEGGASGAMTGGGGAAGSGGAAGEEPGGAAGSAGAGAPPEGWTCQASFYDEGPGSSHYCDCGCGAPDPDCPIGLPVMGCKGGEWCEGGVCVGGVPVPPGWTCDASYFNEGPGSSHYCDCGCGAPDPDCSLNLPVLGCDNPATPLCGEGGVCVAKPPLPLGWACKPEAFLDGEVCDCECGVVDPDCTPSATIVAGCNPTQSCDAAGHCQGGTPTPGAWTCKAERFGDGSYCDCDCGLLDPDCLDPTTAERGCNPTQSCERKTGLCSGGTPTPSGWACLVSRFSDGLYCDCGCGEPDPDCSLDLPVSSAGCDAGSTCQKGELVCQPVGSGGAGGSGGSGGAGG